MKFAFVILNYKTSYEIEKLLLTIDCQQWKKDLNIYIVDNDSNDNYIKELPYKFFDLNIKLIFNDNNSGFAKGNNIGIECALKDNNDFIIVSNPDILLEKDDKFLDKINETFSKDNNIALIGPSILNEKGIEQNPLMKDRFSSSTIIKKKLFFYSRLDIIYYFLRVYILFDLVNLYKKNNREKFIHKGTSISQYAYSLNGCFLIFTPTFFKYFKGFDPNTFMFCEEHILAEKIYQNRLKSYINLEIRVMHKGGQSVKKDNDNFKNKLKFVLFNTLKSCSYFFRKVI